MTDEIPLRRVRWRPDVDMETHVTNLRLAVDYCNFEWDTGADHIHHCPQEVHKAPRLHYCRGEGCGSVHDGPT